MRSLLQSCAVLLILMTALVLAGCGDRYGGRKEVVGDVTIAGEKLDKAQIIFKPIGEDNKDTTSGAQITNGSYKVPRDKGLKPGKYLVQITSGDGKTPNAEDAGGPSITNIVTMDRVPEDWNVRSKQEVEITSDAVNKKDFAIPNYNPLWLKRQKR